MLLVLTNVTGSQGDGNYVREGYTENATWCHDEIFYVMTEGMHT